MVYVPVSDYVTVRRNRKVRTSLYIKQKMLTLGRVTAYFYFLFFLVFFFLFLFCLLLICVFVREPMLVL
jgi:hypothetical protein